LGNHVPLIENRQLDADERLFARLTRQQGRQVITADDTQQVIMVEPIEEEQEGLQRR